jgi:hypothetical protein
MVAELSPGAGALGWAASFRQLLQPPGLALDLRLDHSLQPPAELTTEIVGHEVRQSELARLSLPRESPTERFELPSHGRECRLERLDAVLAGRGAGPVRPQALDTVRARPITGAPPPGGGDLEQDPAPAGHHP